MTQEDPIQPFDEKAALPELERLRDAIQAARQERQRKSEEFDRFVRGFRNPPPVSTSETPAPAERVPEPEAPPPVSVGIAQPEPVVVSQPPAVMEPAASAEPVAAPSAPVTMPEDAAPHEIPAPATPRPPSRPVPKGAVWTVAAAALVAVIASMVFLNRSTPPPAAPPQPVAASPAPVAPAPASPPSASPAPAAAALNRVTVQLRTVQPVWMRVTVDGQKKVESLVPANQRLEFAGDRAIVVRVGNGGDVMVRTGERETPFGDTGQPVTRTFLKPAGTTPKQ